MGSILFNVRSSIQFGLGVEINEFLVEQSELISQHLDSKEKLKFLNIPFEELKNTSIHLMQFYLLQIILLMMATPSSPWTPILTKYMSSFQIMDS